MNYLMLEHLARTKIAEAQREADAARLANGVPARAGPGRAWARAAAMATSLLVAAGLLVVIR